MNGNECKLIIKLRFPSESCDGGGVGGVDTAVSGQSSLLHIDFVSEGLSRHVGSVRWLVARGFFSLWNKFCCPRAARRCMYV
jgi:hypothetical protein